MEKILPQNQRWLEDVWRRCIEKLYKTSARIGDGIPYTTVDGKYDDKSETDIAWWTNSFYAGLLWLCYQDTKDEHFKALAQRIEDKLDAALHDYDNLHHDVGFMWLLSSVLNHKLTKNEKSRKRAMLAASVLASRYNIKGEFIRAWNSDVKGWAIIDCMLNIPLLYRASEMSGDERFEYIARKHADKTMRAFVRPDGSVHHIPSFDTQTGDIAYLDTAKRVAHYFISSLDGNYVPRCNFRQPPEPPLLDSSAGAIAACGMIEISKAVGEYEKALYLNAAVRILKGLDEKCGAWDEEEEAILKFATTTYHDKPGNHVTLIYGDYYFMEAIDKLRNY